MSGDSGINDHIADSSEYLDESNDSQIDDIDYPVGREANELNSKPLRERISLPRRTIIRLAATLLIYGIIAAIALRADSTYATVAIVPIIAISAFVFELFDSATGMGFGTAVGPLLLLYGYDPAQVILVILLSEGITGILAGFIHNELENVQLSIRPRNEATQLLIVLAGIGSAAAVISSVLVFFALQIPGVVLRYYIVFLVLVLGIFGITRARMGATIGYQRNRVVLFGVLAGFNKGVGGGGYGPVLTLGQILSGIYDKSAVALTSFAEGIVSFVGFFTLVVLLSRFPALPLLSPILLGSVLAAIIAPYFVRILPNSFWRYAIPIYAFIIGMTAFFIDVEL